MTRKYYSMTSGGDSGKGADFSFINERSKNIPQEIKDRVKNELDKIDSAEQAAEELWANAWPLNDVLSKLIGAAKILLDKKDYDGHGWEDISICVKRGEEILKALAGATWQAGQNRGEGWVSVEDRPLMEKVEGGWICTDAASGEFIAAIPYSDKQQPGKSLWWIHHCVVEDQTGLCVVGEDENEPAGYELEDVTHYFPLPKPPQSKVEQPDESQDPVDVTREDFLGEVHNMDFMEGDHPLAHYVNFEKMYHWLKSKYQLTKKP